VRWRVPIFPGERCDPSTFMAAVMDGPPPPRSRSASPRARRHGKPGAPTPSTTSAQKSTASAGLTARRKVTLTT
jgi:hypothetical protein